MAPSMKRSNSLPHSVNCLLQLVDCRKLSTLIDHLLKGTTNSAIDWIQVRAVWGPHVMLDERDLLTPQVLYFGVCVCVCVAYIRSSVSARHVFGGISPGKRHPSPPRKFAVGRNFRKKSRTVLLEYKKKPFETDAVPGRQISQNCLCCWGCALCAPDPLEKQLTALLISHSWIEESF